MRLRDLTWRGRVVLVVVTLVPLATGVGLLAVFRPPPSDWLTPGNPDYWPNVLRAFTFLLGGMGLGMIGYTMGCAMVTERTVRDGHPRRKLYYHITVIACAHGLLLDSLLFYVRARIDSPLSPATPVAFLAVVLTVVGLALMIAYQNSRLRSYHGAAQVLATIQAEQGEDVPYPHLMLRVYGSEEPISIEAWLDSFCEGELVRLTVEKVEEP